MNNIVKQIASLLLLLFLFASIFAQKNENNIDSNKANTIKILFNPFILGRHGTNDFEYVTLEYENDFKNSFVLTSTFTYKPKKKLGYYSTYYLSYYDFIKIRDGNVFDLSITTKKYLGKLEYSGFYLGIGLGGGLINNTLLAGEKMRCFAPRTGFFSGYQSNLGRFVFDFRFLNFYYFKIINKNDTDYSSLFQYKFYFGIGYKF